MSGRLLIINADDLGYDPAVTDGILRAMTEGLVTSTTLMVNTPHSAEAAARVRPLAVGLHLNLARWQPLSPAIPVSLLGRGGDFVEANPAWPPPTWPPGTASSARWSCRRSSTRAPGRSSSGWAFSSPTSARYRRAHEHPAVEGPRDLQEPGAGPRLRDRLRRPGVHLP